MKKGRTFLPWIFGGLLRVLLWGAAAGVVVYVSGGWFLPRIVERELARQFDGAAVSVQGARFSGAGVLIKGLTVAEQDTSLAVSPTFFAERVWVGFAPAELAEVGEWWSSRCRARCGADGRL